MTRVRKWEVSQGSKYVPVSCVIVRDITRTFTINIIITFTGSSVITDTATRGDLTRVSGGTPTPP